MAYDKKRKRWRVRMRIAGKQVSRDFKTRDEHDDARVEMRKGRLRQKREPMTFEEFSKRWLEGYCRVEKAQCQWKGDEQKINRHLTPALGSIPLSELRKSHLAEVKIALKAKGLKPQTVNNLLAIAKKMAATAVEWDLIAENPWAAVKPLKVPERTFDFWTVAEFESFREKAAVIDPEMTRLVTVAFHTGLRAGELGALTKADLDFQRGQIRVRATLDLNTGARYERTKNAKVQWVRMNAAAREALEPARFGDGPVFRRDLFWSLRRKFGRLCLAVESRPIRFHDLRHSFASNLAMAGVDLMQIQKLMRHASYQMTLRYAHLLEEHYATAADVLCAQSQPKSDAVPKKPCAQRDLNPQPRVYEAVTGLKAVK